MVTSVQCVYPTEKVNEDHVCTGTYTRSAHIYYINHSMLRGDTTTSKSSPRFHMDMATPRLPFLWQPISSVW